MSEVKAIEVHTITKPVWDMTGGEKRKFIQKDHPEFLIDIVKKSDFDTVSQKLELAINCLNNISDNNNEEIALQLSEWALEAIQKIEAL